MSPETAQVPAKATTKQPVKADNTPTDAPKKGRGRQPGTESRPADEVAIVNLKKATSRLLWFLAKNPADAFGIRLARCAKSGVDRQRAEKALVMIEEAVALCRTQFTAAYEAPARPKDDGKRAERPNIDL